jgi:hypothetical protein
MHRVATVVLFSAAVVPVAVRAQAERGAPTADDTRAWISAALGPGSADGRQRVAGIAALWATHGAFAASLRSAGTSRLFEPGDMGDVSVLIGAHPVRERRIDGVIGVGLGQSRGHDALGALPRKPVVAIGGQLLANYAVVGIGIDGFAGLWSSRRYYGIGLALAVGAF